MLDKLVQLLCGAKPVLPASNDSDHALSANLVSHTRAAEMDIAERDQRIRVLEMEVQRLYDSQKKLSDESVKAKLESFFAEVAAPVSQLLTQVHLLEDKKQEVNVKDTMRLVKRLIGQLEETGLQIQSQAGQLVSFDPNHHEPLSSELKPKAGESVLVKIPSVGFDGRVIRKAAVARVEA